MRQNVVQPERIERAILIVRGHKVLLDADLAALYGVETRRLNEQVRRNIDRFPDDFMFQLTGREFDNLKSQIATSSAGWGGKRKLSTHDEQFVVLFDAIRALMEAPEPTRKRIGFGADRP